jgi:hypothetical protein
MSDCSSSGISSPGPGAAGAFRERCPKQPGVGPLDDLRAKRAAGQGGQRSSKLEETCTCPPRVTRYP